jgi:G3E family GTPase
MCWPTAAGPDILALFDVLHVTSDISMAPIETARVPLVLLTGFLGAGKTTVLNRVLEAQHHRRVAVIVNELGRIDIDGRLLKARSGDVVELAGGCVCHQVRTQEELWSALDEVLDRSRPERIVLETTGIAEPEPILRHLASVPADRRRVSAAGVVTVVDVGAALRTFERHPEARLQVIAADRLLLAKTDLVTADGLAAVHRTLDGLNRAAERASFPRTDEGTRELVPWLLDRVRPAAWPPGGESVAPEHDRHHAHGGVQLVAAAYSDEAPLLAEPLLALCRRLGPALVRAKGFVNVAGEARRGFIERAGSELSFTFQDPWPPGPRRSEFVLIGDDLDPGAIRRQIWACRSEAPAASFEE